MSYDFATGRYTIVEINEVPYVCLTENGLDGNAESVSGRTKKNAVGNVDCLTNVTWSGSGTMKVVGLNVTDIYVPKNQIKSLIGKKVPFKSYAIDIDKEGEIVEEDADMFQGMIKIMTFGETNQMDDNSTVVFGFKLQGERVYPEYSILLDVTAGLFDFSYTMVEKWVFADGSESTELNPTRTLTQDQTVKLYTTNYGGELYSNNTRKNYIGDVSALANLTHTANFRATNVTGDISALANLTHTADFSGTNVTGDIAVLSNLTHTADFFNTNVTGDVSALANLTHTAGFGATNVTGDIAVLSNLTHTADFSGTNVTGDIAVLSNLTSSANFFNTNVTGNIAVLANLTYLASFDNTNVTGDIAVLSNLTYLASFINTNVSGVINPNDSISSIFLQGTSMTEEDTLQSLRNMNTNFTTSKYRTIQLVDNVDQSSTEVVTLVNSLIAKGCRMTFV